MTAQAIHCDQAGCPELADMLVSNLANGDTLAFCGVHWLSFLVAGAEAATTAEAEAADAEAAARLEAAGHPPDSVEPATIVKRGTSRSRRAHEAKRRSSARVARAETPAPDPGPDEPTDEPTDEPATEAVSPS